jgi:hypothetical protein
VRHLVVQGVEALFHRPVILVKRFALPGCNQEGEGMLGLANEALPMEESVRVTEGRLTTTS